MSRIAGVFEKLKKEDRAAFIPFIVAGDPDRETSLEILKALPAAGADIIELGVAFTDPMADGPSIQAAGLRALKAGQTLVKTLEMVKAFRAGNDETPLVLMGYLNPIHRYGFEQFAKDAADAGVDGLIVVDAPAEEDGPLRAAANGVGLDIIRLATPTSDDVRLPSILSGASGFLYYVSVAGVTGGASAARASLEQAIERLKRQTPLPVGVGFGIKTPEQAAETARFADAVVVGSALVDRIAQIEPSGQKAAETVGENVTSALETKGDEADIKSGKLVASAVDFAAAIAAAVRDARSS